MDKEFKDILPGIKPVMELLANNPGKIKKIYSKKFSVDKAGRLNLLCRKNHIPIEEVESNFLDSLCHRTSSYIAHQGVIALLHATEPTGIDCLLDMASAAPLPLIIALDQIQDPGNLGTLCRTAYALGCAGMIVPKHNSAALGPAAMKASAGALEKLPLSVVTNLSRALDTAEEKGFFIYGAGCEEVGDGRGHCENAFNVRWSFPSILVLGNEAKGIRPGVAKRCGIFVSIPFARHFDSLNIAQAGAILIASFSAQYKQQANAHCIG